MDSAIAESISVYASMLSFVSWNIFSVQRQK
jgi:hypothetical protein